MLIIIAIGLMIIFLGVLGAYLLKWSSNKYNLIGNILGMSGFVSTVLSLILAIAYCFWASSWFGAKYKAEILNREYNTSYTQAEIFWASDVIDMIRELDRKRIQLNGNLITGESSKKE